MIEYSAVSMMGTKGLHVGIVGAGIGGVLCSIAIARAGGKVTMLEAAQQLGEIGAGIQMVRRRKRFPEAETCINFIADTECVPIIDTIWRGPGHRQRLSAIPGSQSATQRRYSRGPHEGGAGRSRDRLALVARTPPSPTQRPG